MLHTVGGAAGEGVHEAVGKEIAKFTHAKPVLQVGVDTVVQFVADAAYSDALPCI